MHTEHRLYRDTDHRVLAGVCSGIAEYFKTDAILVRIIFIFLTFFGASGILLYVILWVIIPDRSGFTHMRFHTEASKDAHSDSTATQADHAHPEYSELHPNRNRGILGFFIVIIGLLLLANNLFPQLSIAQFWPIVLILFGLALLVR